DNIASFEVETNATSSTNLLETLEYGILMPSTTAAQVDVQTTIVANW
ncbi:unnamed protein product, partial [Allacma fusca]